MARILIPDGYWTPFRNEILNGRLQTLKEKNAAAVYVVLYDRAHHNRVPEVKASYTDIAKWAGLDPRVVKDCVRELRHRNLIHKSKSRRHVWKVPLAKLDLKNGNFTPVPRILIQKYIPVYHNAVLLLQVLRTQSMQWCDFGWASTRTLGQKMGWSETRARYAMMVLSSDKKWEALETGLPRPGSWWKSKRTGKWHYHVRAVRYESRPTKRSQPTVRLRHEFAKEFGVPILK